MFGDVTVVCSWFQMISNSFLTIAAHLLPEFTQKKTCFEADTASKFSTLDKLSNIKTLEQTKQTTVLGRTFQGLVIR